MVLDPNTETSDIIVFHWYTQKSTVSRSWVENTTSTKTTTKAAYLHLCNTNCFQFSNIRAKNVRFDDCGGLQGLRLVGGLLAVCSPGTLIYIYVHYYLQAVKKSPTTLISTKNNACRAHHLHSQSNCWHPQSIHSKPVVHLLLRQAFENHQRSW